MAGRLRDEASAYLRQHAGNPVDWWPFGDQAFEQARLRDVPVFISVGYAACHWCHVMAAESFEDEATAGYLNEHFVSIKVDREERPDVDDVYMSATQALTGQGGWPMSVFALPDGRAFYAGTYFPPRPAPGRPSFRQVLEAVADAWRNRRAGIEANAATLSAALGEAAEANRALLGSLPGAGDGAASAVRLEQGAPFEAELAVLLPAAVRALALQEDQRFGGFGDAPKFPPSSVLQFLLRHAAAGPTGGADEDTSGLAAGLAARTLEAMACSALYDQLEGGFARYSVDRRWSVPHFEKMLYDNVQLLRAYAQWAAQSPDPAQRDLALGVAGSTADWLVDSLGLPGGGLASSLDADTVVDGEHVEGGTYLWSVVELHRVLGPEAGDADWVASVMGVGPQGTVTADGSPLHPGRPLHAAETERWNRLKPVLRQARRQRPQPGRDDKVVAGWNGLAVAALAEAADVLGRPELLAAAEAAAGYLLRVHVDPSGRLARVSHDGAARGIEGLLEDYAGVAEGLFTLYGATGDEHWYAAAEALLLRAEERFLAGGTLLDEAEQPQQLSKARGERRAADPLENATPSGASLLAGVLVTYAAYHGSDRHRRLAERLLGYLERVAPRLPQVAGWGMAVAQAMLSGPVELAVVGEDTAAAGLVRVARRTGSPGMVIARRPAGVQADTAVPLLRDRPVPDHGALAYVCRGMVCQRPVADEAALRAALAPAPPQR
ncbi:thioredoxin domain-containing protein [Arthrobacter sp. I2-34]|uniref:Thioredoxin domain-containing protein n=1 Tax=Arthrobacter hankyongi TaxID=2904801 RepID=A0ABS9L1W2_9MICC|nr:thioredoxin domain-containing protein [Arthrobacter hankyongi]MCG2620616.1 thioredoxin domain-containing protein [Arthrobacter hankyongi]